VIQGGRRFIYVKASAWSGLRNGIQAAGQPWSEENMDFRAGSSGSGVCSGAGGTGQQHRWPLAAIAPPSSVTALGQRCCRVSGGRSIADPELLTAGSVLSQAAAGMAAGECPGSARPRFRESAALPAVITSADTPSRTRQPTPDRQPRLNGKL
jgi:hypothetical protein